MNNLRILVIGSGARENALIWKLKQSPKIGEIFVAPGNVGTASLGTNLDISEDKEILDWIESHDVDLVIVGPDSYLESGIVGKIQRLPHLEIPVFGPTRWAAQIEWSKAFAKKFMKEEGIPTAKFENFSNYEEAISYVEKGKFPIVIKASGLALGKGVVIAQNLDEAKEALNQMMKEKIFGDSGDTVVIEEYLVGREISIHAFSDGEHAVLFPASQDHKRIFENDEGSNTGGMGTIAPIPWVSDEDLQEIKEKIVLPTIKALKRRDTEFKGLLFPGIMMTAEGPKVIEFNARFGDPETESYMRILETDLVEIIFSCIYGVLDKQEIKWSKKSAATIMLASKGYPGSYEKGNEISGLENIVDKDIVVFHAGTKIVDGKLVTNGGRVLGVSATGEDLKEALNKAYEAIKKISFEGMQYRKDIGKKSI